MITKHFIKILIIFTAMIILGLLAMMLTNQFTGEDDSIFSDSVAEVAE